MKKNLLSSVVVLLLLLHLMAKAQDPGGPDTVFFKAGTPCSGNGDTLYIASNGKVFIQVWVATDESTKTAEIPLTNTAFPSTFAYLDTLDNGSLYDIFPAAFNGTKLATNGLMVINTTQHPPDFFLAHMAGFASNGIYYGDTLFATLTYTVSDTGTICLDTTGFFRPSEFLGFLDWQGHGWVPEFFAKCFYVRTGGPASLQVSAPATDTGIVGKPFSFSVQVSNPSGDLLEDGAWLLLRNLSTGETIYGTSFIKRISGQGTSSGVYEVSFTPASTGQFNFEMKLSGINGAAGFDTTRVFLLDQRGDVNGDGRLSVADVIFMINVIVGRILPPADWWPKADVNCNLMAGDMGDVVYLVNYLFKGGPGPYCY
jgi:hypothetical protein